MSDLARAAAPSTNAADRASFLSVFDQSLLRDLLGLAESGLPDMLRPEGVFAHTRLQTSTSLDLVGINPRYDAIVALGANTLPDDRAATLLGTELGAFLERLVESQAKGTDLGAVALSVWAAAEAGVDPGSALERLHELLRADAGRLVVPTAWALTALLAVDEGSSRSVESISRERSRLLAARTSGRALFPHWTDPSSAHPLRRHVGCFADQVYPIQALARLHRAFGDLVALDAASAAADGIVQLQGATGQWWWHYDARRDSVVEGYPVYSVHQHAMAPMALLDLVDAGGRLHGDAIGRGLRWLTDRPETDEELIRHDLGLVWRKVARREPRPKLVRAARSAISAIAPPVRLSALDRVVAPGPVDHECRPYELGWLLYAWADQSGQSQRSSA